LRVSEQRPLGIAASRLPFPHQEAESRSPLRGSIVFLFTRSENRCLLFPFYFSLIAGSYPFFPSCFLFFRHSLRRIAYATGKPFLPLQIDSSSASVILRQVSGPFPLSTDSECGAPFPPLSHHRTSQWYCITPFPKKDGAVCFFSSSFLHTSRGMPCPRFSQTKYSEGNFPPGAARVDFFPKVLIERAFFFCRFVVDII